MARILGNCCSIILVVCVSAMAVSTARADMAHPDAFGDAQDVFGVGPPLLDIQSFDIRYDRQSLYFTINFFTPIAAASEFQPNSLGGVLEFDVDQDLATGGPPAQNGFSPPFATLPVGIDFQLDFFSEQFQPGFAELTTRDFVFIDLIPVTYDEMAVQGMIPLTYLGGDDGLLDFTGTFGTFPQPTDATDKIGTSYFVPEPGTGVMTLIIVTVFFLRRER